MKNKFGLLSSTIVLLISVLGCSFYNPLSGSSNNSNVAVVRDKSLSEKTIDATVGEEKIGVPECDEVVDFFAEQAQSKDDNYFTKATREYFFNKIREQFKKSIEENKGDAVKLAKECKEYKKELDKYKAEEDSNKQ
ncbi:MAG: hypothetical protein M3033_03140 [Acidobacteriota bacterium]|nr:hypothetical protein [Acidobacteriota bacterium]